MRRNTFELAKQRQGYIHAQQRPSCHSCQHAHRMVHQGGNVGLQCMLGGFFVTAMGACERHEKLEPQAATPAGGGV